MSDDEWETDEDGNILVLPMTTYQLAFAGNLGICARIVLTETPLDADGPQVPMQLVMTAEQAEQLAADLLTVVRRLTGQHAGETIQ